jgi:PAS domain S-box-containing protein
VAARDDEDELLRSVAIRNAQSILAARERAERELIQAKEALEAKSAQLAHSLAMVHATIESTTDGVLVVDQHGKITLFNERFLQMWRLSRAQTTGAQTRQLLDVVGRQFVHPAAFRARIEEIYAASPPETYDLLELADGRAFERYSKIQVVDRRTVGRVWSFREITERRRAEDALRDETRVLEILNRTGTTLASKLDLQAVVQAVTDAATQLSGAKFGAFFYNVSDAKGDSYVLYALTGAPRSAFEKFGQPRATALFGPTFRGEGPIRVDDVPNDPRYGQLGPHFGMPQGHPPVRSFLAVPVASRSGEVIGGLFFGHPEPGMFGERAERLTVGIASQAAVAIDNARLYEAEQTARAQAERMSEMKDEFLATLSHELRTPLSAILGWSQVLKRRKVGEAELEQALEIIERNARVQTQLIEDLLDMSRITSGKVRLDIQPVEPSSFIDAAVETVRLAASAKGVRLEKVLDPAAGPISGDPNRLQQVVWNLLSNAIKFTPKEGKVQVVLERVNSHIEISVADTGIGIQPEFVGHVFERFRQADASTTRRFGGLGLGLSIVKHLVELHGGTVRAHSLGEGRGTTFTVHLPLAVVQRTADSAQRVHPRTHKDLPQDYRVANLTGVRVLVVDDETDARELLRRVLADCGAEVLAASNAAEALRLVPLERPHVLVSDIGMPEMDGYELLKQLRGLGESQGGKLPAIALTAFARSEDRTRALRAGFLVHVSKPVEPSELVATVASVAGRTG